MQDQISVVGGQKWQISVLISVAKKQYRSGSKQISPSALCLCFSSTINVDQLDHSNLFQLDVKLYLESKISHLAQQIFIFIKYTGFLGKLIQNNLASTNLIAFTRNQYKPKFPWKRECASYKWSWLYKYSSVLSRRNLWHFLENVDNCGHFYDESKMYRKNSLLCYRSILQLL